MLMQKSLKYRAARILGGSLLALLFLAGCEKEEIEHRRVPHIEMKLPEAPMAGRGMRGASSSGRMLAVMVPHGDRTWFFKVQGPPAEVEAHKAEVEQFLQSIHFTDGAEKPLTWTLPAGWQEKGGSQLRYATLVIGGDANPIELTVIPLGRDAGSLKSNIDRWRGQLGLPPADEAELARISKRIKIDGNEATLVDLTSAGDSQAAVAPQPSVGDKGSGGLQYSTPPGWKAQPPSQFAVAAFQVGSGADAVQVTVSPLSGPAGGLLSNVNRWRGQIGLAPTTDEQLAKEARELPVGSEKAVYVDLTSPTKQRILGAVLTHGGQTWFFKMKGPADKVESERAAFEAFVQSIQF